MKFGFGDSDMRIRTFNTVKWILFLWELPQNVLGLFVLLFSAIHGGVKRKSMDGIIYYETLPGNPVYGVSLGIWIFLRSDYVDRLSVHHEYGHQIQGLAYGPLYLIVIGIPSGLSNTRFARFFGLGYKTEYDYYWRFRWERGADRRGGISRAVDDIGKRIDRSVMG